MLNEVFVRVLSDEPDVEQEISDKFSFMAAGHQFHVAFRKKKWDGRKRLYTIAKKRLYRGLLPNLIDFATENGHKIVFGKANRDVDYAEWSDEKVEGFLANIDLKGFVPRDYQKACFKDSMQFERGLYLLPTSAGKSLNIYMLTMARSHLRTLIVVPTIGLVTQMTNDFIEYGCNPDIIQPIMSGEDKELTGRIIIGTWQSLVNLDASWFNPIGQIIIDEVHHAKASSITWLMENRTKSMKYRYGFTGTLNDTKLDIMTIEGLFSKAVKFISTSELMDRDQVSKLQINIVTLKHDRKEYIAKVGKKPNYAAEIDYIVTDHKRNKYILTLLAGDDDNTIVFYQHVHKQGVPLYEMIKERFPDRTIHFISQTTKAKDRERIRQEMDAAPDGQGHIVVASYGTSSTGISIKSLGRAIFASSFKSRIRSMQSIGRILRLHKSKGCAILYDIADDLRSARMKVPNHSLRHRNERIKQYVSEGFNYINFDVILSDNMLDMNDGIVQ